MYFFCLQAFVATLGTFGAPPSSQKFDILLDILKDTNHFDQISGSNHSRAGFAVEFKRSSFPFFVNTYLPTAMLTIISFIGFLIPVDMVPGRMALLVTIFLMLVNISSTERSRGPIVRCMKTEKLCLTVNTE